jgi:hypothetical protein
MMSNDAASFIGSIPQHYDQGLGPIIFVDYAAASAINDGHPVDGARFPRNPGG